MRIDHLFGSGKPTVSFEFFPPKREAGVAKLRATLEHLSKLRPDFCSVTCGAGGTMAAGDAGSITWAKVIRDEHNLQPLIHLTCFGRNEAEMQQKVAEVKEAGLDNILALRGDIPEGMDPNNLAEGACRFAIDLIKILNASYPEACLCGGAYPEGHQDADSHQAEMDRLKQKVDAGLDFLITQLFFVNESFYRFRDDCRKHRINVPIVAGILPVTSDSQLDNFVKMTGVNVPPELDSMIRGSTSAVEAEFAGAEFAIEQCRDLMSNGVDGVHFYTLNRRDPIESIVKELEVARS